MMTISYFEHLEARTGDRDSHLPGCCIDEDILKRNRCAVVVVRHGKDEVRNVTVELMIDDPFIELQI